MARTAITATPIPATGLNITDATYATMGTGAGNGVSVSYDGNTRIVLKNDTGGAATFTVKIATPTSYSDMGVTSPDMSIPVANGKTWEFKPPAVWRQADGNVYIDCNVAGKVLVTS